MKRSFGYYEILVFFGVFISTVSLCSADQIADCQHYWEKDGKIFLSGKVVGEDLGVNNPSSRGLYRCKINISENDFLDNKFLFIGQVGDAAYLQLNRVNSIEGMRHPLK